MPMLSNVTGQEIVSNAQTILLNLRRSLKAAEDFQRWLSGLAVTDLTASPGPAMSTNDAQDIMNAMADANGLAQLYRTGTDPRTLPAGYNYGTSQVNVLGPELS